MLKPMMQCSNVQVIKVILTFLNILNNIIKVVLICDLIVHLSVSMNSIFKYVFNSA